jgi:hypothetical protein
MLLLPTSKSLLHPLHWVTRLVACASSSWLSLPTPCLDGNGPKHLKVCCHRASSRRLWKCNAMCVSLYAATWHLIRSKWLLCELRHFSIYFCWIQMWARILPRFLSLCRVIHLSHEWRQKIKQIRKTNSKSNSISILCVKLLRVSGNASDTFQNIRVLRQRF